MSTQEKIMFSTIRMFNKHKGNMTVDDVCKDAGVAKGTVFNHFPTKDNLLFEAYAYSIQHVREATYQNLNPNMSLEERIQTMILQCCKHAVDFPELVHYSSNYHNYMGEGPFNAAMFNPEVYKGLLNDPILLDALVQRSDTSVPEEFILMSVSCMFYALTLYVADHPNMIEDKDFLTATSKKIYSNLYL